MLPEYEGSICMMQYFLQVTFEQPSSGGQLQQPAVGESEPNKVDEFGSFKYWREPVPTLDLDSILQEVRQQDDSNSAAVTSEDPSQQQVKFLIISTLGLSY